MAFSRYQSPSMARLLLRGCLVVLGEAFWMVSCATSGPSALRDGPLTLELEYTVCENITDQLGYVRGAYTRPSPDHRDYLWKEPVYFSKQPLYGSLQYGEGEDNTFTFALDESRGTRSGYDTLYFDANNNEDLTDDPKLMVKESQGSVRRFPLVELQVPYGAETRPFHLLPCMYSYDDIRLSFQPACFLKGELAVGSQAYLFALVDDTGNGLFNDYWKTPEDYGGDKAYARGDCLVFDLDGDGKFEKDYLDTPEAFHLGKYLGFGPACLEVDVPAHGRRLTFKDTETECGTIAVKAEDYSAELLGPEGAFRLQGKKAKIPAGEYDFFGCSFRQADKDGKEWRLVGRGQNCQKKVKVAAGEKTKLTFGPPLTARVVAARSGREFDFNLAIEGQARESYSVGRIEVGAEEERPSAPAVKIKRGDGKTLARGRFEYG